LEVDGKALNRRFAVAEEVIADAGRLAMGYAGDIKALTVRAKAPQDMVSEADLAVETLIRHRLLEAFPEDGFLGEETGVSEIEGRAGVWVVDPIDGTVPFLNGFPSWCVSVAYVWEGEVVLGLVNRPSAGELFTGGVSRPALRNGQPMTPHTGRSLADGLTYLGCSNRLRPEQVVPVLDRLLRAGGMFVRNGSGAIGLCDVACGRLLGFVEAHINSWDCLGAVAVLQSAGARVNDYLTGDALLRGNHIIAGPPQLYDMLEEVLGVNSAADETPGGVGDALG
jgi:myo-inositol-1(or 4)-monophosphatase